MPLATRAPWILAPALLLAFTAPRAAADPEPPYPLDATPRDAATYTTADGELQCPPVSLVDVRGDVIRYHPLLWVNADFRARLPAFERVVREAGIAVYGRAPDRIVQLGGYGCRRMREHSAYISEHALGNAIDIEGFDFGHLPKGAALPAGLDKTFANGFEVRVLRHWGKKTGHAAVHARFLREVAQRLVARKDLFRVLLGPGYPGHNNHFHFDMSPFRLVQIFEDGQLIKAP
jgi:hypothetical protein